MPRPDGDGIAVDIPTRAGLVTVVFTGRGHARATPAAGGAFTYRGRAAVAAHLREHPEIPGQASQARARIERAWAVRELELLTLRIIAAERQLAGLRREETALRAIASDQPPDAEGAGAQPAGGPAAGEADLAGPPGRCGPELAAPGQAARQVVFDVTAGDLRHKLAPGIRAVRDLTALTSESLSTETPCCGRRVTIPVPGPDQARPAFCCLCRVLFTVRLILEEPDGFGGDPPHVAVFEAERLDVTVARHRAGRWERQPRRP